MDPSRRLRRHLPGARQLALPELVERLQARAEPGWEPRLPEHAGGPRGELRERRLAPVSLGEPSPLLARVAGPGGSLHPAGFQRERLELRPEPRAAPSLPEPPASNNPMDAWPELPRGWVDDVSQRLARRWRER